MGKGMLELKNHKEKELWKMWTKYMDKTTKLLPIIANLAHEIKIFKLLKGNFIMIKQELTFDKLSWFVHTKLSPTKRLRFLKIWLKYDMEKSLHCFPLKLTKGTSLDPWLSNKTFIY